MYYTAIIFFRENRLPLKYRNINRFENFEQFARQKGAWYINYYFKGTKQFSHRQYLK